MDIYHHGPGTIQAASNIVRCLLAAGGLAALQPVIDRVGVGYAFTVLAILSIIPIPLLFVEYTLGLEWRRARNRAEAPPQAMHAQNEKRSECICTDKGTHIIELPAASCGLVSTTE